MSRSSALLLPLLLLAFPARSQTTFTRKVSISEKGRLDAWIATLSSRALAGEASFTECREIAELPRAFLCASDGPETMNAALGRVSIFATAAGLAGTVLHSDSSSVSRRAKSYAGHDLSRERLDGFYAAVDAACTRSSYKGVRSMKCLTPAEASFKEQVYEVLRHEPFFVAAFPVRGKLPPRTALNHEVRHAQHALDERYREACEEFWTTTLTEDARAKIRKALFRQDYNDKDPALMADEFQAYMLMEDAQKYSLGSFVAEHQRALLKRLADAGVRALRIEF